MKVSKEEKQAKSTRPVSYLPVTRFAARTEDEQSTLAPEPYSFTSRTSGLELPHSHTRADEC